MRNRATQWLLRRETSVTLSVRCLLAKWFFWGGGGGGRDYMLTRTRGIYLRKTTREQTQRRPNSPGGQRGLKQRAEKTEQNLKRLIKLGGCSRAFACTTAPVWRLHVIYSRVPTMVCCTLHPNFFFPPQSSYQADRYLFHIVNFSFFFFNPRYAEN